MNMYYLFLELVGKPYTYNTLFVLNLRSSVLTIVTSRFQFYYKVVDR